MTYRPSSDGLHLRLDSTGVKLLVKANGSAKIMVLSADVNGAAHRHRCPDTAGASHLCDCLRCFGSTSIVGTAASRLAIAERYRDGAYDMYAAMMAMPIILLEECSGRSQHVSALAVSPAQSGEDQDALHQETR